MKCSNCGHRINEAKFLGRKGGKSRSEAKLEASRRNGTKGGRPKKVLPSEKVNSSTEKNSLQK